MKKHFFLIPLVILSCNKKEVITESSSNDSSLAKNRQTEKLALKTLSKDSLVNTSPVTNEVLREGVSREIDGNKIIRTADFSQLPFSVGEEFTDDHQQFIMKINNFSKTEISAKIVTISPNLNVRINQIKLPDGTFDGPFGAELNYKTPQKGEYWIIIGHNLMADGEMKGKFTLQVK